MRGSRALRATGRGLRFALLPPLILLVFLIALWELAVTQEWVSEVTLPQPEDVVTSFADLVTSDIIWNDVWATLYETVVGFLVGAGLGIALAIPSGLSNTMRQMLRPYAISLQVTPRIAIAPIVITWFGFGYTSKIVIAAIIAFFPVYVNTLTGMITVDEDEREMFRSLGASRAQTFTHLMLPSSLPVMFAGLKTAIGLALIGAVVGEFISAQAGLGLLIQQFSYQLAVADAFAVLLILTIMGLLLYGLMEFLERITVFWLHDSRLAAKSRRRAARYGDRLAATGGPRGGGGKQRGKPPVLEGREGTRVYSARREE
jgi:NitT/TauT family transport system permease protein